MLSHGAFAWCDLIWYVVDGTGRPSIDALLADLPAVSAQVSQPPSAASCSGVDLMNLPIANRP